MRTNPGIPAIAAALCLAAAAVAAQQGRPQLEGWGPFKFSMNLAQATAAVAGKAVIENGTIRYPVTIDGRPYQAIVKFRGSGERIGEIEIGSDPPSRTDITTKDACVRAGEELVGALARRYGKPDALPAGEDVQKGARLWRFTFADGARIRVSSRFGRSASANAGAGCTNTVFYDAS
jgi:hypothetical protein